VLYINDKQIAIFSDIHFGKSKDSHTKLKIAEDYIVWFIQKLKENNIKTVLFLGDLFNNRNSISVKTLDSCYTSLKRFSDNDIKIIMLVGNHDMYMKEDDAINSIAHYSEIKGVTIVEETTDITFINDKKGVIFPFITKDEQIVNYKNYDYAFGHFEFFGALMTTNQISDKGISSKVLEQIAPLIFSGHFHIGKEYIFEKTKVVTVGSTHELDWGDYNVEKHFIILNVEDSSYITIKNDFSPTHVKIYWSDVKKHDKKNFNRVAKNYIKIVVDSEYEFDQIIKLVNLINMMKPIRSCEVEYLYNVNFNSDFAYELQGDEEKKLNYTHIDYMNKFVEETPKEQINDLDISIIKNTILDYYTVAASNVSN